LSPWRGGAGVPPAEGSETGGVRKEHVDKAVARGKPGRRGSEYNASVAAGTKKIGRMEMAGA